MIASAEEALTALAQRDAMLASQSSPSRGIQQTQIEIGKGEDDPPNPDVKETDYVNSFDTSPEPSSSPSSVISSSGVQSPSASTVHHGQG